MSETPSAKKLPSPRERLDLILLGLARRESATKLCKQAGVSRELFYRWMRAVREAGLKALEVKLPGPKRIQAEKAPKEALKLIWMSPFKSPQHVIAFLWSVPGKSWSHG